MSDWTRNQREPIVNSRPKFGCRAVLEPFLLRLAALLLVLHWAAPNLRPLDAVPGAASAPVYATGSIEYLQSTLPRGTARIQTVDTGAPNPQRPAPPSTGKLAALAAADQADSLPSRADERPVRSAPRFAFHAHAFEARGPPLR